MFACVREGTMKKSGKQYLKNIVNAMLLFSVMGHAKTKP